MAETRASDYTRVWLNLVLAVAQVAATGLYLTGVGASIAEQSARTGSVLTPPDWTFSIWAVIYPGMILYGLHCVMKDRLTDDTLRRIGLWTALAMAANTAWAIVTILYGFILPAFLLIGIMLIALLGAFIRLGRRDDPANWRDTVFVVFPVSVFTAWIAAATIVNGESWLRSSGLFPTGVLSDAGWNAVFALAGGVLASSVILWARGNIIYATAFCWALAGVTVRSAQLSDPIGVTGAVGAIGLVIGAALGTQRMGRRTAQHGY